MERKLVSIVVPCYNEQEAMPILYRELKRVTDTLTEYRFEYLFVDDGSSDRTLDTAKALAREDDQVRYVSFSRNFGKEAAIAAGLRSARGDYVTIMDADLQDPPALLPQMIRAVDQEGWDSASARRVDRKGEPPIRSAFARLFYKIMRKATGMDIADGARDYRLMSRKMVDSILSMTEYNRFSKGIFAWVGFRTKWIEFENVERAAGETKWSFWKLVRYSLEGITNFSDLPLQLSSWLGLTMTLVSFIAILFIIVRKLLFGDPVSGWPSLVCIITFIGGIQLFCMGIMGQYVAKTYMETKHRPLYLIREDNLGGDQS